jgi:hypothetical protein
MGWLQIQLKVMYQKNKNLQPYFEEKMQKNNEQKIKKRRWNVAHKFRFKF